MILEMRDLDVVAGGRTLLEGIDLAVHRGELVTVVGPNGAGKTTLVKAALGLIAPAKGEVWRAPGLQVGYMPQRVRLEPAIPLTAGRFLSLGGGGASGAEAVAQELQVEHLLESPVQNLSGGEMQRLLMARALLRNPDLLVLDEPVQGVDIHGQAELYALIAEARSRRGCAVLMVSHDLHLVMASTDRVVCINRHLCCTGTPESVTRNPAFIEVFGPAVADTLAVYSHNRDHRHAEEGSRA